ncbi:hypothetical protein ACFV90_36695 [Streptomyces sp. NPDC059904]|uniref:hypothetical protein n=1 Tax=Streptomyces sp. NPDC059904 TaxID=3346996 RepID=UPI00364D0EBF
MSTLNFVLAGRDHLSRVLDRAGDSADRLGRRLMAASINGDAAMRRFTNNTTRNLSEMQRDTKAGGKALEELKKATLLLAPAAIPAAASLAPIAAGAGAVAVASGVLVAAMIPQISAIGDASDAHKKYEDAVAKSGARSTEAVQAQIEYQRVMAQLPPKTREAAASVSVLKDETKAWSDSLAGDTMAPFVKGVAIANSLLPKTKNLVKGTASEADRFMTIVGGEMASPGLDRLNSKFTAFSQKTLRGLNDEFVHLLRLSDSGQIGGAAAQFMDWARAQGPAVGAILRDVANALVHVLDAGSDVGVGLLQVVGVLADVASAVPPSAIALFLQLALALKVTKMAALGLAAGRSALVAFAAQIVAMNTAAAAAPTRLAAVRVGIAALSRTAKVAMAGTGIGLLLIALSEIAARSETAPPDVDKLTVSLRQLGATGKVTGEAAKAFGSDLGGLHDKIGALTDPSNMENVQQWIVTLGGIGNWDSTPVKEAKGNIDSIDKSLAGLVSNGQADLAAAALKRLTAEYGKGGRDTSKFTSQLNDYKSALADSKFEQELAAQAMGIFGSAAQKTQLQLDAQKQSAEGLRQSIIALNDVNRSAYDAQISFEAGLDSLTAAFKKNGATLDISTEAGRNNGTAMSQAAKAQDEMIASGLAAGDSLASMTNKSSQLRSEMMRLATDAFDGNKRKAAAYVNTLLGTPGQIKTLVKLERQEAVSGLESVQAAIRRTPGAKTVKVDTLNGAAIKALEAVGLKTRQLRDGKTAVYTTNGQALGSISAVQRAINNLHSKTITLTSYSRFVSVGKPPPAQFGRLARGGRVPGYAGGGDVQSFPGGGYVDGPGTGTSDSILALMGSGAMARVSNTEFVMRSAAVKKYGVAFMNALNEGRLNLPGLASGGMAGAGADTARGLAAGMGASTGLVDTAARRMAAAVVTGIKTELQIASPSKRTTALAKDVGSGLIKGLTGSKDKIKATSKDLAKDIWSAFSGSKDNRLVAYVNKQTKTLTSLAGKRDSIASAMKRAKDFAETTRVSAKKSASLGGMFEGDEQVTAAGISSKLQQRLAKMRTFSSYIKSLAKRGLNKTMLREILEMGPEEGYAYASALTGASSALFKEINSTQYKINDQAESLGKTGADALYDSGKNAGKGFLKGLQSQQKAIEAQMLKIARGMDKAIRRALGIKSPSTVMAQVGRHSTEGLAVGLTDRMPVLDRALSSVSGRVAATRPVVGRPAVAVGSGGGGVVVNVTIGNAMDPIAVGREFERVLLKYGRAQGTTVRIARQGG